MAMGNKALTINQERGWPVRVIRGVSKKRKRAHHSPYAPSSGYRYDGLFYVADHWSEIGRDGYIIFRYWLVSVDTSDIFRPRVNIAVPLNGKMHGDVPHPSEEGVGDDNFPEVKRGYSRRLMRDDKLGIRVKALHEFRCQFCGAVLLTRRGHYAEAAHIQALGRPHHGPDVLANMLCLCSDDHVRFDTGTVVVNENKRVFNILDGAEVGPLREVPGHHPSDEYFSYHREYFAT
ncbi:YDG/SRA domain-containing protein [Nocardiopsis mangrovi]|uniref:YDG/SRA domain-containing protein n=1 Tax=Nocardiopsis mangrovi TaxID=1179818 RepID=A0ABV9DPE7_9ACTN